jgi:hypothetical protein
MSCSATFVKCLLSFYPIFIEERRSIPNVHRLLRQFPCPPRSPGFLASVNFVFFVVQTAFAVTAVFAVVPEVGLPRSRVLCYNGAITHE